MNTYIYRDGKKSTIIKASSILETDKKFEDKAKKKASSVNCTPLVNETNKKWFETNKHKRKTS